MVRAFHVKDQVKDEWSSMLNQKPDYRKEQEMKLNLRIRELEKELPSSVTEFMRSIAASTSSLTRLGYAYDLRLFFRFLISERVRFANLETWQFGYDDLAAVDLKDIEMYQEYLTTYVKTEENEGAVTEHFVMNEELGISRKLSALRSFYKYLYVHEYISENVTEKIRMPKIKEKPIIYLDREEIIKMIDTINTGEGMTERQKKYVENTRVRDLSIIMLLLGTGIRESELVGMDMEDVDLEQQAFVVTRKGGNQMILYFNESIRDALADWITLRSDIEACPGHENALFLSIQKKRITTRAIQDLVKKYARIAAPLKKKISPHKLRSTYATTLYRKTGDIYQVSKTLGHKSVSTTKRYTQESEDTFRDASENVDWV